MQRQDLFLAHPGLEDQEENRLERLFRRCEEPLKAGLIEHHPPDVRLPEKLRCRRTLLARSRPPPFRGHTPSAPRYVLRGVGCLKQIPNAVFQQCDSSLQGAELSDPHHRDGHVQVK